MPAISRRRGIAPRQTKIAGIPDNAPTEATTRVKEKLLIPVARQRQLQLELVLRRNVASHVAVLLDLAGDLRSSTARISAGDRKKGGSRPLAGTLMSCADVMTG